MFWIALIETKQMRIYISSIFTLAKLNGIFMLNLILFIWFKFVTVQKGTIYCIEVTDVKF